MDKTPRMLKLYRTKVVPQMMADFKYKTVMAVPKVTKVVVNVGTGRMVKDAKFLEKVEKDIEILTGQKPSIRKAKKSIAGFKLREGTSVGIAVTLRGRRMYDFIDRLISIALPRTRDFRGLSPKAFDREGNLNIGIKESNIFPEIKYETLKDIFSLGVTITTTSRTKEEGTALLRAIGFPIQKNK